MTDGPAADQPPYDYPQRVATPEAADREMARLRKSMGRASRLGDTATVRYLDARITRAQAVRAWHA